VGTKTIRVVGFVTGLLLACLVIHTSGGQAAAATITVDTNQDTAADDGQCSFREAIVAANDDTASGVSVGECSAGAGIDTIEFAITGSPDYTNAGQNGYTIALSSSLPALTQPAIVDGYSQPGSRANTAPSPQPLNGVLLIEVSGQQTVGGGMQINTDDATLRGIVINHQDSSGLLLGGDNIQILGVYIGVEPSGMVAAPNRLNGINGSISGFTDPDNAIIGTTNPADRNIVSGNRESGITPNVGQDGWTIRGTYVGMAADGLTPLPNSIANIGPGGLSIDNCVDITVGGIEQGAGNLISGNNNFGIFPDNVTNLVIQGNIIGPNWRGEPIANNPQLGGIGMVPLNGNIQDSIVGGIEQGAGNIIAYNNGPGVVIMDSYVNGVLVGSSQRIAVIGNSIHGNTTNDSYVISQFGLGIDLLDAEFTTATITNGGVTPNDTGDGDAGPNDWLNYPVLHTVNYDPATQKAQVELSLDATGSPSNQYRVELFANSQPDSSGYGEGQQVIGAFVTSPGMTSYEVTLKDGLDLGDLSISATATALDGSTPSGFGATSEFARVVGVAASNNPTLAQSGTAITYIIWVGLCVLAVAVCVHSTRTLHTTSAPH
jgi:CSLREA domain-containing protein